MGGEGDIFSYWAVFTFVLLFLHDKKNHFSFDLFNVHGNFSKLEAQTLNMVGIHIANYEYN